MCMFLSKELTKTMSRSSFPVNLWINKYVLLFGYFDLNGLTQVDPKT